MEAVTPVSQETGVPVTLVSITDAEGNSVTEAVYAPGDYESDFPDPRSASFAYRSVTKSMVGTVVLQLAEEGAVDLDAPISEYLDGVPGGDDITVYELGVMRSGLADYTTTEPFLEMLIADPHREPQTDELLEIAFAEEANFSSGTAFEYSNTNTLLLGKVIEEVTDMTWQEAVSERITGPLGLDSVRYGFEDVPEVVPGFRLDQEGDAAELPGTAPGWVGAAGGLTGDITDLATWGQALGTGELIDEETLDLQQDSLGPTTDDPTSPITGQYGFGIVEFAGWVGHPGAALGYQSLVLHNVESGMTVAILMNGTGPRPSLPIAAFRGLLSAMSMTE